MKTLHSLIQKLRDYKSYFGQIKGLPREEKERGVQSPHLGITLKLYNTYLIICGKNACSWSLLMAIRKKVIKELLLTQSKSVLLLATRTFFVATLFPEANYILGI